jgi:DNA-binding protein Fis
VTNSQLGEEFILDVTTSHLRPSRESLLVQLSSQLFDSVTCEREAIKLLQAGMARVALERTNGNVSKAAALLGRHRNDLNRRLALFGMKDLPRQIREAAKERGRQLSLWKKTVHSADSPAWGSPLRGRAEDLPRAIHSAPKLRCTSPQALKPTGT